MFFWPLEGNSSKTKCRLDLRLTPKLLAFYKLQDDVQLIVGHPPVSYYMQGTPFTLGLKYLDFGVTPPPHSRPTYTPQPSGQCVRSLTCLTGTRSPHCQRLTVEPLQEISYSAWNIVSSIS